MENNLLKGYSNWTEGFVAVKVGITNNNDLLQTHFA